MRHLLVLSAVALAAFTPPCELEAPWQWKILSRTQEKVGTWGSTSERLVAYNPLWNGNAVERNARGSDPAILHKELLHYNTDPVDACEKYGKTADRQTIDREANDDLDASDADLISPQDQSLENQAIAGLGASYPISSDEQEAAGILNDYTASNKFKSLTLGALTFRR